MEHLNVLAVHENVLLYRKDGDKSTASLVQPRPFMRVPSLATRLTDADVGAPGVAGSANSSGGVWTVSGSGANIWRGADQFHFAYQQLTGDGSIIARVVTQSNTGGNAKVGVMIRESLAANATCTSCDLTPDSTRGPENLTRLTTGGRVIRFSHSGHPAPYWVKVERTGNRCTAYDSPDGQTWTPNNQSDYSMGNTVYAGLIVCSMDNSKLCTATFYNVRIGSATPSAGASSGDRSVAEKLR